MIFVLSYLSPTTGTPDHQTRFDADPSILASILETEKEVLHNATFALDERDLHRVSAAFRVPLPDHCDDVGLSRLHMIDRAPYLVHTGYELPLMLEGRKPLAHFTGEAGSPWLAEIQDRFSPHMQAGTLLYMAAERERTYYMAHDNKVTFRSTHLLYALPGEEWRFDALLRLVDGLHAGEPWTEAEEREQGTLLGYSAEQCDWWIAHHRLSTSPDGTNAREL